MNEGLDYDRTGLDLTVASEGIRLDAYPDPATGAEPWTIGCGHTGTDVFPGKKITLEEAYQLLHDDVQDAVRAVRRLVTVPLTQGQFDALVDFTFNCGAGNLGRSTLLKLLNAGDYAGARTHFDDWVMAGGRTMPGLIKRRDKEEAVFDVA
jgi:lysozyme